MKRLTVLAATAAMMGWAGSASAADIYDEGVSMKDDIPYVAPLPTWSGFYLGIGGGGSATTYDSDIDGVVFDGIGVGLPIFELFEDDSDLGDVSAFGTVQVGLDRQVGHWVFGLFADYDWMDIHTDLYGNTVDLSAGGVVGAGLLDASVSTEIDNMWSVGGRIGFLASPSTLVYGLFAYTQADVNTTGDLTVFDGAGVAVASLTSEGDFNADGFTVGAGIETKLAEPVSLKFEYRYTNLDDGNLIGDAFLVPGVFGVTGSDHDLEADIHTVRAVLVWRPGWSERHDTGF